MNILSFSGFIPEQICDTARFMGHAGGRRIPHYCGYAADFISQVMDDQAVDGAAFPRTCDSSRTMGSYLEGCGTYVYQFHVPARRDAAAVKALAQTVRDYRAAVERHFGVTIADDDIRERILLVNERNRALARLYGQLEWLPYHDYLGRIHALLQMPLREQVQTLLRNPLSEEREEYGAGGQHGQAGNKDAAGNATCSPVSPGRPESPEDIDGRSSSGSEAATWKRAFLVGSFLCDVGLAKAIEGAGLKVVGDNLTESKRLFSAPPVKPEGDLCRNIAESMLRGRPSPTQGGFHEILGKDREEMFEKRAQCVIFVTQKYCEPYDYLYYAYQEMLAGMGMPCLKLARAGSMESSDASAAIEAFADSLQDAAPVRTAQSAPAAQTGMWATGEGGQGKRNRGNQKRADKS